MARDGENEMSAYIIVRVDVRDWDKYREYTRHTPRVLAKFGGRFIARGSEPIVLEGPEEKRRIVLIEFPSLDQARAFYESDDYKAIKKKREDAGEAQLLAVDGYNLTDWEQAVRESQRAVAGA
jgi:uncharacterized protein (DUF1330 family)